MWQPGRETSLRRPSFELQQAGPAGGQRHRRRHRQTQAQALATHRCCKSNSFRSLSARSIRDIEL